MARFDFEEFDLMCAEALETAEQSQREAKLCLHGLARLFNGQEPSVEQEPVGSQA